MIKDTVCNAPKKLDTKWESANGGFVVFYTIAWLQAAPSDIYFLYGNKTSSIPLISLPDM